MKKIILGGVCATALVISAAVSVISCSGDDEYYEGGNYTLANKRMTRSEEFHYPHEGYPAAEGAKTLSHESIDGYIADVDISWGRGFTGMRQPRSRPSVIFRFYNNDMFDGIRVEQESLTSEWKSDDCIDVVFVYSVYRYDKIIKVREKFNAQYTVSLKPDSTLFDFD